MILGTIYNTLVFICYFIITVVAHELGHYLTYWFLTGSKPELTFKRQGWGLEFIINITEITKKQKAAVTFNGLLGGLLIIAIISISLPFLYTLILLSWYIIGSRHDLKLIIRGLNE